jgi:hypothetical protein
MSDVQMKLEQASKLLSMGKLPKKSENFINSLKRKKNVGRLTKRQYEWLTTIAHQYQEVSIFKGVKEEAETVYEPLKKQYNLNQLETEKQPDWFNEL